LNHYKSANDFNISFLLFWQKTDLPVILQRIDLGGRSERVSQTELTRLQYQNTWPTQPRAGGEEHLNSSQSFFSTPLRFLSGAKNGTTSFSKWSSGLSIVLTSHSQKPAIVWTAVCSANGSIHSFSSYRSRWLGRAEIAEKYPTIDDDGQTSR